MMEDQSRKERREREEAERTFDGSFEDVSKGAIHARNMVVNSMPTSLGFDFRKFKQTH